MTFPKPTTKEQMYSILKDIFYYYRVRKADFEKETLKPLELKRLPFVLLNEESLLLKAGELVASEQMIELAKLKLSLGQEIDDYRDKMYQLTKAYNVTVEKITVNYNESVRKIQEQAIDRGVGLTSVVTSQLADLESSKNQNLSEAEQTYQTEYGYYQTKHNELMQRYNNLSDEYSEIFESQKRKKYLELKDEQDKLEREVFKYNNSIDEKEQRSENSIAQSNATLQLKYMEISSGSLSKDQLIDMGYYADVIDCVCAYYDTFEPLTAWRSIANDGRVAVYLEDYYTQIVFMYQSRAEAV